MRFLPIATESEARELVRLPVFAVDLGFSSNDSTTGVAWSVSDGNHSENQRFSDALATIAERFRRFDDVVLVVEAPLSAAFDKHGNPRPRGSFERNPKLRWWSMQAGAVTALAALFFLRRLKAELSAAKTSIHLAEGLVSGSASRGHNDVATVLRDGFQGKCKCRWHVVTEEEGNVVSALEWLREKIGTPPAVLEPLTW